MARYVPVYAATALLALSLVLGRGTPWLAIVVVAGLVYALLAPVSDTETSTTTTPPEPQPQPVSVPQELRDRIVKIENSVQSLRLDIDSVDARERLDTIERHLRIQRG